MANLGAEAMNAYWHLMWKEYRAIRVFWIAVIVLAVLLEFLLIALSQNVPQSNAAVWAMAFGAPVLFAFGCAGASFAVEKEEGTIDFLRAAPVTAQQLLVSKLTIAALATIGMYVALWALGLFVLRGRVYDSATMQRMFAVAGITALEAIAWGTLFSLIFARPLVAIMLAFAAASTVVHIIVFASVPTRNAFQLDPYFNVSPTRLAIACAILVIDVLLGLRWLHGNRAHKTLSTSRTESVAPTAEDSAAIVQRLLGRRSRWNMLGRLFWQHARQSAWLMGASLIFGPPIALALVIVFGTFVSPSQFGTERAVFCIGVWVAIAGAMVFLPDQTRGQYRFFSEHNVPPRFVWLTRLLCWSLFVVVAIGVAPFVAQEMGRPELLPSTLPQLALLFGIPFAVGQWCSMFIRSGIMAGFMSVLFGTLACGWYLFMFNLQVPLWFSVLPIPLGLLFATWRRAPDWIRENATWRARLRAAGTSILGPAIVLVAAPLFRVHEIPAVIPGFDPSMYLVKLHADQQSGRAGADLYRAANDAYVRGNEDVDFADASDSAQAKWLEENEKTLQLILQAIEQPTCIFNDPTKQTELSELRSGYCFYALLVASAHRFEAEGNLDAALDRYFVGIRVVGQLATVNRGSAISSLQFLFSQLTKWAALPNQTPERIRRAREKLQALDTGMLQIDSRLKFDYVLARKSFLAGEGMTPFWEPRSEQEKSGRWRELMWGKLMPWENERAVRALDMVTADDLELLKLISQVLRNQDLYDGQGAALAGLVSTDHFRPTKTPDVYVAKGTRKEVLAAIERQRWLETTVPHFTVEGGFGFQFMRELVEFEALRRGTVLILALEEYRLDHDGELPMEQKNLVPTYLAKLPIDPYSGLEYRYFPTGLPIDSGEIFREINHGTEAEISPGEAPAATEATQTGESSSAALSKAVIKEEINRWGGDVEPDAPCIWCTARDLFTRTSEIRFDSNGNAMPPGLSSLSYYQLDWRGEESPIFPSYSLWGRGLWFPIPAERKSAAQKSDQDFKSESNKSEQSLNAAPPAAAYPGQTSDDAPRDPPRSETHP